MAQPRHKRDANARRFTVPMALVAAPIALLVTGPAVAIGVLASEPTGLEPLDATSIQADANLTGVDELIGDRGDIVSRSGSRGGATDKAAAQRRMAAQREKAAQRERAAQAEQRAAARAAERATQQAVARADLAQWTTTDLNLWGSAAPDARQFGLVEDGMKVLVTGRQANGRVELAVRGQSRWVTAGYLADEKPEEEPAEESGVLAIGGACTNGTSAGGAGANVQSVHQAVCAVFPEIASYGTLRGGGGDHSLGRAIDIMVSGDRGWQVAEFVRANYATLGVSYVIYAQNIWSVERGGEGWRPMSDRGSVTANHYDHVHVSTY